jgi:hypothetical protein
MATNEKGCPAEGSPILRVVLADNAESKASHLKLQAFCLARRFAISVPMAEALAPLVYGEVWR